jgi:hypothetical protein
VIAILQYQALVPFSHHFQKIFLSISIYEDFNYLT